MNQLYQYSLDFSQTLAYIKHNLQGTNVLSTATSNHVLFEEGEFYTLLYKDLTQKQLYGFKYGGVGGGSWNEAIDMIFKKVENQRGLFCIFDNVNATYTPTYDGPLFLKVGVHYKEEVYYLISPQEASKDLIKECLCYSAATWHSLCVLSKTPLLRTEDRSISEKEIIEFVSKADLILVGAYDDEGYIFWKRNTSSSHS